MTITVHLKKRSGLNGIYPISVMSSSSTTKYHVEMNLVKEIIEFLSNQFEYREGDTEVIFDVCDREIDKYIAECVNDTMDAYDPGILPSNSNYRMAQSSDFCSKDFINEITVVSGLISLPGEEVDTLSALIKLYFTNKDITIVER